MTNCLLVFTTCPTVESAARITEALLMQQLAACVNQLAATQSTYRWQGSIESAVEYPLIIKTTADRYTLVEQCIRQLHPYTLPEVIALAITAGFAPYLRWMQAETQPPQIA